MGGNREVDVAAMNESNEIIGARRRLNRQSWGLAVYAWPLHFILLASGFSAFPDAAVFIASCWILARLLCESITNQASMIALARRSIDDTAERTTRHAILLAHQRGHDGIRSEDFEFWPTVKRRVEDEYKELDGEPPPPLPWWKSAGLVTGNVALRLIGDLITIGIAAAIAS